MELDLVASRGKDLAFAVDCKHWRRTVGQASMTKISERQLMRARRLAAEGLYERVVPVILTWRDESLFILRNRIPIVPIHSLQDFILNWEQSDEPILVIEGKPSQNLDNYASGSGRV
jgi:hypothetical protein